jgi:hypothetical protein
MNVKSLLSGSIGTHYGIGFARTSLLGQLGFLINQAARQKDKKDETPVADAELNEMFGDNGLPKPVEYDLETLVEGMAAAYVLSVRHARTPDSRTGRINEKMQRFITSPKNWIQRGTDYALDMEVLRIKAQAAAFNKLNPAKPVSADARITTVTAEIQARNDALVTPIQTAFKLCVKERIEDSDEELVTEAMDAYAEAGRDLRAELREGAKRIIDAQRTSFVEGKKFVEIDPTLYALAGLDSPVPVADVKPVGDAAVAAS